MAITYNSIATITLNSATSTITFTSIPNTYTDLEVILVAKPTTGGGAIYLTYNNDTGTSVYSDTNLRGNGTAAASGSDTNMPGYLLLYPLGLNSSYFSHHNAKIMSYAGSTQKSSLFLSSADANGSGATVTTSALYRSTTAINRIDIFLSGDTFTAGTTATLYGILKA